MKFTRPDPKPAPRPKRARRGLQPQTYEEALERRRRKGGRAAGAGRGTSHSRRPREWGRMAFAHTWRCDVGEAFVDEFGVLFSALALLHPGLCRGRRQYMHLHLENDGGVRPPDRQGAIGCEGHHDDIDGRSGRRARAWYVTLGAEGQLRLKHRLVDRQCARWDALTPAEQDRWEKIGADRRNNQGREP